MKLSILSIICFLCFTSFSQVKISEIDDISVVDASAILEVKSSNKGFLPPRLTSTQIASINQPAKGLVVYDLTTNCLSVNIGTKTTRNFQCVGSSPN